MNGKKAKALRRQFGTHDEFIKAQANRRYVWDSNPWVSGDARTSISMFRLPDIVTKYKEAKRNVSLRKL